MKGAKKNKTHFKDTDANGKSFKQNENSFCGRNNPCILVNGGVKPRASVRKFQTNVKI
jgi:hypothetical protein